MRNDLWHPINCLSFISASFHISTSPFPHPCCHPLSVFPFSLYKHTLNFPSSSLRHPPFLIPLPLSFAPVSWHVPCSLYPCFISSSGILFLAFYPSPLFFCSSSWWCDEGNEGEKVIYMCICLILTNSLTSVKMKNHIRAELCSTGSAVTPKMLTSQMSSSSSYRTSTWSKYK